MSLPSISLAGSISYLPATDSGPQIPSSLVVQAPRWSPVATTAVLRRAACPPALPVRAAASEVRRPLPSLVRVPVILVLFSLGGNAEARQLCACAVGLFVDMKKMNSGRS